MVVYLDPEMAATLGAIGSILVTVATILVIMLRS